MIALSENEYEKIIEPLAGINMNTLFARAVVERRMPGAVYVDDTMHPQTFYVAHPYGLSLLFGDTGSEAFNAALVDYMLNHTGRRRRAEQLMAFPDKWHDKIAELLLNVEQRRVTEGVRINFKFNRERYLALKKLYLPKAIKIERTDGDLFSVIEGTVIPKKFWRGAEEFCRGGAGYTAIENDEPASTAYAAFIDGGRLEIGIETVEKYRGRKFALAVCAALVDYCLEKGYEPLWACRADNTASYRLALKLGFEPVLSFPFYHLPV